MDSLNNYANGFGDKPVSKSMRWENANRWYEAELICDLLGDWTVIRCWGGKHSKHHGLKLMLVENEATGYQLINEIDKSRMRRKPRYWRVYLSTLG